MRIHKENVRKAPSDPATVARLSQLRNVFTGLTDSVDTLEASQVRIREVAAAKARKAQVAQQFARAEALSEKDRRASDRSFFFRPSGHLDKDLWEHQDLRSWYSGGAATGSLAGPDFGGETLGSTLRQNGYVMSRPQLVEAPNPYALESNKAEPRLEDTINTSRFLSATQWRAQANQIHWIDRESLLNLERKTAEVTMSATGYRPELVEHGKPFKSRTVEEDSWRFQAPSPKDLKETMMTSRVDAAKPGVDNFRNSRVSSLRALATERSNFF